MNTPIKNDRDVYNTGPNDENAISEKSAVVALFLCLFTGMLGLHRFYVGKFLTGLLMLLTFGGFGIWTFIDLIFIASGHFTDSKGKYLTFRKTKRSPFMILLFVIPLIFVPLILWFLLLFSSVWLYTRDLTFVADQQFKAIRERDINKAYYDYTSIQFRNNTSLEDFKSFIEKTAFKEGKAISFGGRSIKDNKGYLEGVIKTEQHQDVPILYFFVKENNEWKIFIIRTKPLLEQDLNNNTNSTNSRKLNVNE